MGDGFPDYPKSIAAKVDFHQKASTLQSSHLRHVLFVCSTTCSLSSFIRAETYGNSD
jgi:hypothetical protein